MVAPKHNLANTYQFSPSPNLPISDTNARGRLTARLNTGQQREASMESQNSDITTSSTEEYCNKVSKENNMDVDPCPPNTSS